MALFLSSYVNKIDKKGRVSVPSSFRAVLQEESDFAGIIIYPSFVNECIEACSFARLQLLNKAIDQLDPYSEERDAFATAILAGSHQLAFDSEGRILLPENLIESFCFNEQLCFVGKGETFEIWQPEKFNQYLEHSRLLAKSKRAMLKNSANREI